MRDRYLKKILPSLKEPPARSTPQPFALVSPTRKRKPVPEALRRLIAAGQKWRCESCAGELEATFEVDHTRPLCEGGADDVSNMRALCPNCHAKKTQLERMRRSAAWRDAVKTFSTSSSLPSSQQCGPFTSQTPNEEIPLTFESCPQPVPDPC
jgi:hypothetical protein